MNLVTKMAFAVGTAVAVGLMVAVQKDAPGWAAVGFGLTVGWQVWLWLNRAVMS